MLLELLNDAFSSFPRLLQRPDSTQNAAIGMRPELGGTMKSRDHPILIAAAHDIAGLNVDVLVRKISDGKLVHVFGFINPDLLLRESFLKRQEGLVGQILSVLEEHGEIAVSV